MVKNSNEAKDAMASIEHQVDCVVRECIYSYLHLLL